MQAKGMDGPVDNKTDCEEIPTTMATFVLKNKVTKNKG
jgi:hypothetical protein